MKPKNSIIIPQRKGSSSIVTITPRQVVVVDQDHQSKDSTSCESSIDIPYPSDQEVDSESETDRLHQVRKELQKKLGYDHVDVGKNKATVESNGMLQKWFYSKLTSSKHLFKWMIIVLNVFIESIQVVSNQDASTGQMSKASFSKFSLVTACICLVISISDIVFEGWEGSVTLRKRGFVPWFYYPGKHGRVFGSFWVVFGLVSSMVQFWLSLVAYVTNGSGLVRIDYFPLLLAFCFLLATVGGDRKSMWVVVKCELKHGEYEIEGKFVHGRWYLACPSCETAVRSV